MMAAVSTTPNLSTNSVEGRSWRNPTRPSEIGSNVAAQRRLKPSSREVTSRYMSNSSSFSSNSSSSATNSSYLSSRRSASPLASRTVSTGSATPAATKTPLRRSSPNKRPQSAERRRPATPTPVKAANGAQISAAAKVLVSSKRSLSLSFQGDSLLTPISKTKPAPAPNSVKATAERRTVSAAMTPRSGELRENARSSEQRPWPGRSRQVSSVKPLSKSVDLGSDRKKLIQLIGRSGNMVRSLKSPSLADRADRISCHDKLQDVMSNSALLNGDRNDVSANLLNLSLDSESICSESNSGLKDDGNMSQIQAGPQGVIVPARVWELTKNQLRRTAEPSAPVCGSSSLKATISSSPQVNLTSRGVSPLRGGVRPESPSRLNTTHVPLEKPSSSRAMGSPSRIRNGTVGTSGSTKCSVPSLLCFAADVRRGKLGQNKISDAHLLRLLHNRHLQWRFANSRVEATLSFQRLSAERNLYNTWKAISDLRLTINNGRMELTRLRLKLKLFSILKEQMTYLENWTAMEKDYVSSLLGVTESFRASTVQLPFVCGATADILKLKGAICSAVDVLLAMASSICSLMSEVEKINSLLDEVVSIATREHTLLDECKDFLSTLAAFQVEDCSLRGHISQMKRVSPPSLPIEA